MKQQHTPWGLLIALTVLTLTGLVLMLRFVFFFDWDAKTGRFFTDMANIDAGGIEHSIEDDMDAIRNSWYEMQQGGSVREE